MGMTHYNVRFKPLPTFVVACLFIILMSLGIWQLHRADYKRQLQTQYQQRSQLAPVSFAEVRNQVDNHYYPVTITGHFDNQHQFLLDNQFSEHRAGYHVVTPFILIDSGDAVLINRGWLAASFDRATLPKIPKIEGTVTLNGIIQPINKTFILGNVVESGQQTWPRRIQKIDIAILAKQLPYPIANEMILLTDTPYRFAPIWVPINTKPYVHTAYACQWFALAATLLIIYTVVCLRRKFP